MVFAFTIPGDKNISLQFPDNMDSRAALQYMRQHYGDSVRHMTIPAPSERVIVIMEESLKPQDTHSDIESEGGDDVVTGVENGEINPNEEVVEGEPE